MSARPTDLDVLGRFLRGLAEGSGGDLTNGARTSCEWWAAQLVGEGGIGNDRDLPNGGVSTSPTAALHACDTPDCPSWFWCTAHQTATSGAVKGPATCTLVGPYMTREEAEAWHGAIDARFEPES